MSRRLLAILLGEALLSCARPAAAQAPRDEARRVAPDLPELDPLEPEEPPLPRKPKASRAGPCTKRYGDRIAVRYRYGTWGEVRAREHPDPTGQVVHSVDRLAYRGGRPYEEKRFEVSTVPGHPDRLVWTIRRDYDHRNRLVLEETTMRDGFTKRDRVFYEYQEGRLVREVRDGDADGRIDWVERHHHDASGRSTRIETFRQGEAAPHAVRTLSYDAAGRLVRTVSDMGADGTPDSVRTRRYDAGGNLLAETTELPDGRRIEVTYTYDCWNVR